MAVPVLISQLQFRSPSLHLSALMALAVLLGGGGVAYGMSNMAVQLAALLVLAVHHTRVWQFFGQAPLALRALVVLSVALPVLQIVPLPPGVWQSLPGRELVSQSHELAGLPEDLWFPLSVDAMRSLVAFCGTLAPATIVIIGVTLDPEEIVKAGWLLIAAALVSFAIGTVQLVASGDTGMIYPVRMDENVMYATFANRNTAGLFFVLATILTAALPLRPTAQAGMLRVGLLAIPAVGVILTQSRSSMVLLLLAAAFVGARLLALRWPQLKLGWLAGAGAALAAVLALLVVTQAGGRLEASLERFSDVSTDRPGMWEDGIYAAQRYWPVGSGMGTFDEVFQIDESLENVSPRRAGRAHNDFIELGIEAGMLGYVVLAGWLVWIGWAALRPGQGKGQYRWTRLGAALGLACIAAQSILDYPLRNQTLLCVAALLVAMLAVRERRAR